MRLPAARVAAVHAQGTIDARVVVPVRSVAGTTVAETTGAATSVSGTSDAHLGADADEVEAMRQRSAERNCPARPKRALCRCGEGMGRVETASDAFWLLSSYDCCSPSQFTFRLSRE